MIHPDLPALALSVRQPWAWALFNGKHVENRSPMAVRNMHAIAKPTPGKASVRLAIHAAKGMTRGEYEHARQTIDRILGDGACPRPDQLVRSAIIGTVHYVECITQSTSPWFFGPRGLIFEMAQLIETPIPLVGDLGFFPWRKSRRANLRFDALYDYDRCLPEPEQPLTWMKNWRGDPEQSDLAPPPYIHASAETPLLDALEAKLPVNDKAVFPIDARTTDDERAGRTEDLGERGVTVTIHPREFRRIDIKQ